LLTNNINTMTAEYGTKVGLYGLGIKTDNVGIGLAYETREIITQLMNNTERLRIVARASYMHKNGFAKITLEEEEGCKTRLHHYPVGAKADENIHNHRWDLDSTILAGSLPSHFYVVDYDGDAEYLHAYRKRSSTGEYEIVVTGTCTPTKIASVSFEAGTNYKLSHRIHHRIGKVETPTITLMRTGQAVSGECDLINRVDRSGQTAEVEPPFTVQELRFHLEEIQDILSMEICKLTNYTGGI